MSHGTDKHDESQCIGCTLSKMVNEKYPQGKSDIEDARMELYTLANAAAWFLARHQSLTIPFLHLLSQQTFNHEAAFAFIDEQEMDRKATHAAPVSVNIN